ncbi:UPF0193 protein EVG1 -like, partial [Asbolus verrucosus]
MDWPSKNVPRGGILHPAKASYSPETHQFLRVLMDENKLSMFQRKKIDYYLRNGEPLPLPSSRTGDELKARRKPPTVLVRPGSSKRRTRETILKSGAYEREKFVPKHSRIDREKEKNRLQNRMAFGKDVEPKRPVVRIKESDAVHEINRFDQLVNEIKEREEWLQKMEELGQGNKYRLVIQQQIQAKYKAIIFYHCRNPLTGRHTAALILARGGSKGIPLKNLAKIGGRSLLNITLTTVLQVRFSSIWVSTDHGRILEEAGAVNVHWRSAKSATDDAPSILGIQDFIENHPEVDVVALIQCTSPFIKPLYLYQALQWVALGEKCVFSAT